MSIRMTIVPALIAGILAATPVFAQTAPAATTAAASAATRHDAMIERRITDLHNKLAITAAEQKPFDDFAQAMRNNAATMDDAMAKGRDTRATGTAVDQMKAYAAIAQAHAQEVAQLVGPFSKLYDSLSPEQKKLADQSFRDFSNRERGVRTTRG